jgi:formylglycine-generating enzyme required for sulfatase activity
LFFNGCSSTTAPDAFISDRNVTGLNVPSLDTARMKSLPDSLSGWQLTWYSPLTTDGWTRTFVFLSDTLTPDQKSALANGSWAPSAGYPSYGSIAAGALSLDLPTSAFKGTGCPAGCRGTKAPTDKDFLFTVWAQYSDGNVGEPVRYRLYLGDEYPPELPAIRRTRGSDSATFAWDSVFDQTSRFVSHQFGQLRTLRWKLWRGMYQIDSALVKMQLLNSSAGEIRCRILPVSRGSDTSDWSASLSDSALINVPSTRLTILGLRPYASYTLVLSFTDRSGQTSTSTSQFFTTLDSLPPAGVSDLRDSAVSSTSAAILFQPPTDSFNSQGAPVALAPNYHIASMVAILNGRRVDSLALADSSFMAGTANSSGNWNWDGSRWAWIWPTLDPGSTDTVTFEVTDKSGNPQATATTAHVFSVRKDPSVQNLSCPAGYTAVGGGWTRSPKGDTVRLSAYCMETYPHADASGRPRTDVSFEQAQAACAADGGRLCSEWEWQHACEGAGDSTALQYGVLGLSGSAHSDTVTQLKATCGLLSGDSTWLSRRDPRCLSPWGIHEMSGPVFELVDSLYAPADTNYAGVRILKGGSWKAASNSAASSASTCRYRNYPAYSDFVTIGGTSVPHPMASFTQGFGFRCCRPAGLIAGRRRF